MLPRTMRYLGEVGTRESWGEGTAFPILPMIATPAHPVVDPDRHCLWTCTYNPQTQKVWVVRVDLDRREVRKWRISNGKLPQTSHTISQTREGFRVELFDAAKVGQGPVAVLKAEGSHVVPFVIHSSWMPATGPAKPAERIRFSEDFSKDQLGSLPAELQKSVSEVAREIDEELASL